MVYYIDISFPTVMKVIFFTIGTLFTILVIILGFENFKTFTDIPYYILVWSFNLPIMYVIFVSAFLGAIAGASYVQGIHAMLSERNEEDGEEY
jgi:uncharacterized integral membrane protein